MVWRAARKGVGNTKGKDGPNVGLPMASQEKCIFSRKKTHK